MASLGKFIEDIVEFLSVRMTNTMLLEDFVNACAVGWTRRRSSADRRIGGGSMMGRHEKNVTRVTERGPCRKLPELMLQ